MHRAWPKWMLLMRLLMVVIASLMVLVMTLENHYRKHTNLCNVRTLMCILPNVFMNIRMWLIMVMMMFSANTCLMMVTNHDDIDAG